MALAAPLLNLFQEPGTKGLLQHSSTLRALKRWSLLSHRAVEFAPSRELLDGFLDGLGTPPALGEYVCATTLTGRETRLAAYEIWPMVLVCAGLVSDHGNFSTPKWQRQVAGRQLEKHTQRMLDDALEDNWLH